MILIVAELMFAYLFCGWLFSIGIEVYDRIIGSKEYNSRDRVLSTLLWIPLLLTLIVLLFLFLVEEKLTPFLTSAHIRIVNYFVSKIQKETPPIKPTTFKEVRVEIKTDTPEPCDQDFLDAMEEVEKELNTTNI